MWVTAVLFAGAAQGAGSKLYDIEYDVLTAALNHGIGAETKHLVIDGHTTGIVINLAPPDVTAETMAEELGTTTYALAEWSRVNRKRYVLQAEMKLRADYTLLDESRRNELFSDTDPVVNWQRFHAAFPDSSGIVRVSRPGIDDPSRKALVYLEFQCGHECGSGRLINLMLDDGGSWRVESGSLVWITSPEESP